VVLLDLRGRSPVTEYFLIATGTSPRQMRTVVDELRDLGKKLGHQAWRMDGYDSARWIVLDCVALVAHVFDQDSRDFYDLELLWGDCPRVDWRAELGLPAESPAPATREAEGIDNSGVSGDADIDEDAEIDESIVMEIPDESTGSNSVEFVEIDPPSRRKQRGRVLYPTTVEEAEDTTAEERSMAPVTGDGLQEIDEEELGQIARSSTKPRKAAKKTVTKKTAAKKPAKKMAKKAKAPAPKKKPPVKAAKPKAAKKAAAKKKPAAKSKKK
jgi:ribosome-associated protein